MTTKERILAIAISELEAKGLDGLSLRAVGQKAGITPMAVYRHFADKAALLQAVGAHALEMWQRRVQMFAGLPLLAGFNALATAFVDFALDMDGKIREVRMQPISPLTDFSFDFQDLRLVPVEAATGASAGK